MRSNAASFCITLYQTNTYHMLHRPVVIPQSDKMTWFYLAELQILLIIVTKDDMLYCNPCLEGDKGMDFEVS